MRLDACECVSVHDQTRKHTWEHQAPTPCVGVQDQRRDTLTRRTMSQGALVRDGGATTPACRHAGLCSCITAHACRRITPIPHCLCPAITVRLGVAMQGAVSPVSWPCRLSQTSPSILSLLLASHAAVLLASHAAVLLATHAPHIHAGQALVSCMIVSCVYPFLYV